MDAVNQRFNTEKLPLEAPRGSQSKTFLERLGIQVSRYGVVVTLLLIGVLKFTAGEAQGIQPLVASSPLMFWLYRVFSLQAVSNLIVVIDIAVAVLIALRPDGALSDQVRLVEESLERKFARSVVIVAAPRAKP